MVYGEASKKRRIISFVLFVLFLLFAYLQLNDPDPLLWVSIYLLIALLMLVSNYKTIPKIILWGILVALLLYASTYFYFVVDWLQTENKNELFGEMVYEKSYLEGTREFLGLLISAIAVVYLLKK
ncbi:transmembrane 220 family protein [uncultured Algibacter sp.]|uniref:transmembrane 220 family protein n=1 Tax=uncultured Algibacter sp. TaxID=298659 RepID=UPI002638F368|nr:transmembrane 220 family protein [uncultured Algibacter sp.]